MDFDVVFTSDYIQITKKEDGFYIESFRSGITLEEINKVLSQHPEIRVTSFMAVKNCLMAAPKSPTKFGEVKDRITIEISGDELKAFITVCVMESELTGNKKVDLVKQIISALNNFGIIYGIKNDVLLYNLCNNKQLLIAEGIPPVTGTDSVIKMYELKEAKPEVKEDGNVDHYELNLINKVEAGDWVGERTDPTPGIPGKTVKGHDIPALPGKSYPLMYDKQSVKEVHQDGVTTLYALKKGAVFFEGDRIGVSNHLEIQENVDFKTGNIDFDGFLTIKGSIEDNFSVAADKDIEILGQYGAGSVKEINSREGSVFIRGGIAGKNKAVVKSKKNIYTKFISDATIICDGSVHIGFYCLNSNIIAKEVILDSPKGQILGGNIQTEIKVVSSIIGSPGEKKTFISVKGFDRKTMKEKLEKLINSIEDLKTNLTRCKQELSIYSYTTGITKEQSVKFEILKDKFFDLKDSLKKMEDEKKALSGYLRTHGEGEIAILKKAYPATILEIKRIIKELDKIVINTSFYVQDGEIREL
ncbi:MAG: FapA family protein [Bacillota bacterium]|nr:FapA family protein [Bacillota bacterium]